MELIENKQIFGRIYKITSAMTDEIYVGSTILPLHQRFITHVNNYKLYQEGNYGNCKSFEIIKHGDASIELITEDFFDNRDCMHRLEGEYIQTVPKCINKKIEGRTQKEYNDANIDHIKELRKDYYNKHKDIILQNQREYGKNKYAENIDESRQKSRDKYYKYKDITSQNRKNQRLYNPDEMRAKDKIRRDKYREKHNEHARTKILCEVCGIEHSRGSLSKHIKTKKHQQKLAEKMGTS